MIAMSEEGGGGGGVQKNGSQRLYYFFLLWITQQSLRCIVFWYGGQLLEAPCTVQVTNTFF